MLHPSAYLVPQYKTSSEPTIVSKIPKTRIVGSQHQYYNQQDVATAYNSKSIPIPKTNSNGMDPIKSMTLYVHSGLTILPNTVVIEIQE